MIEDPNALMREAVRAYKENHLNEAAQLYPRSRRPAALLHDRAAAFMAGVCETACYRQDGRYRRALTLLLPLLANVPLEAQLDERWLAQIGVFEIFMATTPELARLRRALDDIAALAQRQPHP